MKNRIDSSRKKTPWDKNKDLSPLQKFIKDKYVENYEIKHPKLIDTDENIILNNIEIKNCRYCGSDKIKKNGKNSNRIQRYYCLECKRNFISTTNTIFDNHKISITEWIEFLLDIFNYGSTSLTSKVNKNAINTSIYWMQKIFLVLEHWQENIILEDKVYIDEFFYKVIKSDIETKNGKKLRGLSHNQYCIGIGYNGSNIIALLEGLGKPSSDTTKKAFINHIQKGSELIHDDEKSHKILITELELKDTSYNSLWLKTLTDKDNPMRPINHQCDLIRQFLNTHSGFDRSDLQGYLNLYCFMNSGHKNKLEKVNEFMELALTTKVVLNYRDNFKNSKKIIS